MWVQLKKNLGLLSLTRQAKVCNLANEYTMRGQKYLHSCLSNVTYDKTQTSEKCKDCETVREGHFRPGVKGRCVMWHLSWEERLRRRDAESPRAREGSHGDEGSRTIAGGRSPALRRQSKDQRHVKTWTLEEWDLWWGERGGMWSRDQEKNSPNVPLSRDAIPIS